MGEKYWSYQDPFIGNANILAVQAMLQGSLQWTIGTQVKLALSLGKIFAVIVKSLLYHYVHALQIFLGTFLVFCW